MKYSELNNKEFEHIHTSLTRQYVSRKNGASENLVYPYKGRFGVGYIALKPNWESSRYSFVEYWIKK